MLFAAVIVGGLYYRWHQQSKRLTDKDTIVLADFTNSTGDAVFDHTLRQGLSAELEQSPFLTCYRTSALHTRFRSWLSPETRP